MIFASESGLTTTFCGITAPNPFLLSSAPPTGHGSMIRAAFEAGWGGAVVKTLGLAKDQGKNATPRLASLSFSGRSDEPKKLYGLQNIELITDRPLEVWLDEIALLAADFPDRLLIVSIMAGGNDKDGWQELASRSQAAGAKMLELNFSCPHGMPEKGMGSAIGQNPDICRNITGWVKSAVTIPVMPKLTPNITDISAAARACVEAGADAIAAINTVSVIAGVDLNTLIPIPNVGDWSTQGGFSGPAVKPIGLRAVSRIHNTLPNTPISGQGGIDSWREAAEYILLGASNVQICTAVMFKGFGIIEELNEGLLGFMEDHGFESVDDFVGISAKKLTDHGKLDKSIHKVSSINRDTCVKCNLCVVSCRDGGYQAITAGPDRIPVVNTEECTGCSLCQQVCPVWGCINLVEA